MENPERYGYHIRPEDVYRPKPFDQVKVRVRQPIHITDFSFSLGTDFKMIKELNPQILGYYLPRGSYAIKVPKGLGVKVSGTLRRLAASKKPPARVDVKYYTVQPGDTLSGIAKETGVPLETLRRLNGISGSIIKSGQKIRLK
jgi:hypothetical protein